MSVDYYAILGVPRDAPAREIRLAFRRLARRHHPDHNPRPDGPRRFAEIAHAYEVLNDPTQRAQYDQIHPPPAPQRSKPDSPILKQTARRGILELSPIEARHLAHHALTLTDRGARKIVLPAGAADGDEITLFYDGRPVVLTIRQQRKT
jgi:curved DNA-binding protein CbpA